MDGPLLLTRALAGLMAAQSVIGLLLSEHYRDPEPIRTTWFGNDCVTLILAVPLLLLGLVRGRARLDTRTAGVARPDRLRRLQLRVLSVRRRAECVLSLLRARIRRVPSWR